MKKSLVVESVNAQITRKSVESSGFWDNSRKLMKTGKGKVAIPVILKDDTELRNLEDCLKETLGTLTKEGTFEINEVCLPPSKKSQLKTPFDNLFLAIQNLLQANKIDFTDELKKDLPSHWEVHGDLVLLPGTCFRCQTWKNLESDLWKVVASALGFDRVAKKDTVASDGFRTPQVNILLGDDGWVQQLDNGIRFMYDITKCMFSSGNITEKLRIAKFNCEGETIVDLYAGIGYFTLPYLVHAKAGHVHACEWNPDAVNALYRNLQLNNVQDKCTVYLGDNRKVCPEGIADRVNLGLIPSSESGWSVACKALKPTRGGMLHIHGNVTSDLVRVTPPEQTKRTENKIQKNTKDFICSCSGVFYGSTNLDSSQGGEEEKPHRNLVRNRTKCSDQLSEHCTEVSINDTLYSDNCFRSGNSASDNMTPVLQQKRCDYENFENISRNSGVSVSLVNSESVILTQSTMQPHDSVGDKSADMEQSPEIDKNNLCINCGKSFDNMTSNNSLQRKDIWKKWALDVSDSIRRELYHIYNNEWKTQILHIEHVKSYAPYIDHLVLDLECRPIG